MGRKTFKKQITSPDVIEQINSENVKLVNLFLKDKGRKCSEETLKQYQSALNIFFCWNVIEAQNKFYPEIKKIEIANFFDYILDELKVNGKRFAFFKSVLSGLSDCVIKYYDEDERCATFRNFIGAVIENIPKPDVRQKTVWTDDDTNRILDTLTKKRQYQSACLFALGVYSGMRISELAQMQVGWVTEEKTVYNGLFYETPKMRTKGAGKTGKVMSRLILHDLFKPYYDRWVKERQQILADKKIEDHGYLFINTSGQPASQEVLRGICAKWEKIIDKPCYLHALRHAFTTMLANKYKLNPEVIRNIVKWSSLSLVTLYNDKSDEIDELELTNLKNI